jgi:hypothetical protein
MPVAQYRRLAAEYMATIKDAGLKRAFEWQLREIDSGAIRATGYGTSTPSCYTAAMVLIVQPKAKSVEDAVAAWRAHSANRGLPDVLVATEPVWLYIGPAARLTITVNPPEGIPSRTTEYVVLLADHRVGILAGTSPDGDTDFPALVDAAAKSMRGD